MLTYNEDAEGNNSNADVLLKVVGDMFLSSNQDKSAILILPNLRAGLNIVDYSILYGKLANS